LKREAILERLPDIFKQAATGERNPLAALLGVMEELHARDEDILAGFGRYIDPRRTTDEFVPFLAAWVDYAWLLLDPPDNPYANVQRPFPGGLGRLRELVASAAAESKWRGTSAGLIRMLEKATGIEGYRIEETVTNADGQPLPFRVRLVVPQQAERYLDLVGRIVEHEKPAHVIATVVLEEPVS
jgi:phage tail-like protein